MTGLYGIGLSGAQAYQSALTVIGNNLANMNDPNYTRRVPEFSEKPYGTGVDHSSTDRMYNDYLTSDLRNSISNNAQYVLYFQLASALDSYLGNESSSISTALNDFFSAMQNLNSNPSNIPSRQQFINQANSMVTRFQSLNQQLEDQGSTIKQYLNSSLNAVNDLTQQIADLNTKIAGNNPDPSLLDSRDALLRDLAEFVPINTNVNGDGSVDVYLNNGVSLVNGNDAAKLTMVADPSDPKASILAVEGQHHTTIIGNNLQGGSIGGAMKYYEDVLKPAQHELDRLSLVMADTINQQHQQGLNLNNQLGSNFFTDINSPAAIGDRVIANSTNSGSGTFEVTIDTASDIKATDYELKFTSATDYTLTRISDGSTVSSGTISSYPTQISADGFTMNITSGSFAAGDSYVVSPTHNATKRLDVAITKPEDIALAAPIRTTATTSNQGTGTISFQQVTDIDNSSFGTPGQLSPPLRIEFLSDTSYQLVNADSNAVIEGPISFTPGTQQAVFPTPGGFDPGYAIDLSGRPAAGDTFTMDFNGNASGDNRNGLLLAGLQDEKVIGGNSSFGEAYNALSGHVAVQTNSAKMAMDSTEMVMSQAENRRNDYSGVNMEEEFATLLFYEQAFVANTKMVSIADNMFSTILDLL